MANKYWMQLCFEQEEHFGGLLTHICLFDIANIPRNLPRSWVSWPYFLV